ncbi:MAG: SprB repeat-containing protein, partial [Bacteroidales bacterium]
MKNLFTIVSIIVLIGLFNKSTYAQCDTCTETTTFYVDLSENPDSVWTSPHTNRSGKCCIDPNSSLNCIRFEVTTHPDAQQLSFYLAEPPIPPAMEYSPNCGDWQSVDIPMCIEGTGPHCIVYCKPGNDKLKYMITSSKIAEVSPPITVGEGCIDTIWARGFDVPSIQWNVVYPGPEYNSYLSATSGVEEVIVNGPPVSTGVDYFDVEVTGELSGGCAGSTMTDTVRVHFVSTKDVQILPEDPTICYGGSSIELTAEPEGGKPPYNYLWSTGETTKSIWVSSAGDYSVEVTDVTECPPVET